MAQFSCFMHGNYETNNPNGGCPWCAQGQTNPYSANITATPIGQYVYPTNAANPNVVISGTFWPGQFGVAQQVSQPKCQYCKHTTHGEDSNARCPELIRVFILGVARELIGQCECAGNPKEKPDLLDVLRQQYLKDMI